MSVPQSLAFFSIVSVAIALLHLYLGWRILASSRLGPRGRRVVKGVLVLSTTSILFAFLGGRLIARSVQMIVAQWAGFAAMGMLFVLVPIFAARDAVGLLFRAGRRVSRRPSIDPTRRAFLARASGLTALGFGGVLGVAGFAQTLTRARLEEVDIAIEGLPPRLDGFRFVQISDLHIGPTLGRAWLEEVVARVNALEGEMIVFTGDVADGWVRDLRDEVAPLADLRAPRGVFYVTGNHEYYWNEAEWSAEMARLGMTVLENEHRVVKVDGASILIAGVTDLTAGRMVPKKASDPAWAVAGAPPTDVRLLLAHQPRSLDAALPHDIDLMLSGHTHGGQFFPYNLAIHLFHPVAAGLAQFGKTWVYVNRGTGYWGPPTRTAVPSEITAITLRRASRATP